MGVDPCVKWLYLWFWISLMSLSGRSSGFSECSCNEVTGEIPRVPGSGCPLVTDLLRATEARLGGGAGYRDARLLSRGRPPQPGPRASSPIAAKWDLVRSQLVFCTVTEIPVPTGFCAAWDFYHGLSLSSEACTCWESSTFLAFICSLYGYK